MSTMALSYVARTRSWSGFGCLVALFGALLFSEALNAQSTFGTVLGTVKDPSGAAVPAAVVKISDTGTNAVRSTTSNDTGAFQFTNVEVGSYKMTVDATGFQSVQIQSFDLGARETKRVDAEMTLSTQATTVNVESSV